MTTQLQAQREAIALQHQAKVSVKYTCTVHVVHIMYIHSRTSIIRPSIIRNLDYPAWKFSKIKKKGVSAAVTMVTGMFIFCACADAHTHCCLSIKWVDQGVVYPIRLSGYPAWLRNKGVRIIEVLLYRTKLDMSTL